MYYKRLGMASLSTVLMMGLFAPSISAADTYSSEQSDQVIEISAADVDLTKQDLIDRFYELFPSGFGFLDESDFRMDHFRPVDGTKDDVVRHSLRFFKEVDNNQRINGNVAFVGEDLKLQHFNYQPENVQDALYPASVSQDEAKKVAEEFVSNNVSSDYKQSNRTTPTVSWGNQTLTDPVEYRFYFQRMKNGVPVINQDIVVTVLGNGDITQFSDSSYHQEPVKYEEQDGVIDRDEILASISDNLSLQLQYNVQHNYETNEQDVSLVYVPSPPFNGIHARSGDWEVGQSFVADFPEHEEVNMLRDEPVEEEPSPLSRDDVEELAKELLTVPDDAELQIESIHERVRNGVDVFTVQFMIHRGNSGSGTTFDVEKETGEIVNFQNIDLYNQSLEENLAYKKALEKAVEAIETYGASTMHEYAYPINVTNKSPDDRGIYSFSFPQVKNGLLVNGSFLNVGISAEDGKLASFSSIQHTVTDWPNPEDAVEKEEALEDYLADLDVELAYVSHPQSKESNQYHLVYRPTYQGDYAYYDAIAGEWDKTHQQEEPSTKPVITDHWAADELNYMMEAGIISADQEDEIEPNKTVTKGTAIEMIMKSLERFYPDNPSQEQQSTFENIQPSDPLYQVVERAAQQGIVNTDTSTFPVDESLTREELAYWLVRALGLEEAAKHADIYQVPFEDSEEIADEYKGYVALAYAMEILQGNDNTFNPEDEVTLAHLAVTSFRLAEKASELGVS
ncbi:S-layer homology domain-containing protein [Bacillus piscicola]|uniref:S-layer homology domain-containing protein n=1 Tax=Bacillus piscicola TaxID=1632684 RepID=UPI001F09A4B6|nr:S-layer homology domain-containing protein [Bacillus piscicola]